MDSIFRMSCQGVYFFFLFFLNREKTSLHYTGSLFFKLDHVNFRRKYFALDTFGSNDPKISTRVSSCPSPYN